MKKLQSADYIFFIGLIFLVAIAGTIIFLIMSADTIDTSKLQTNQSTQDNDDKDNEIIAPKVKEKDPYKLQKKKIHLDDTIVWAPAEKWTPAKEFEVNTKFTISGTVTNSSGEGIEYAEVGITPLAVFDNKATAISAKPYSADEAPKPVPEIDSKLLDLTGIQPTFKTRTDSMGKFTFPFFTGYYMLFVKKQFYYEQKKFCIYNVSDNDFQLDQWGTLVGRVLNTDGYPINDFMISIFNAKGKKIAGTSNILLNGFEGDNFKLFRNTYHIGNRRFGLHLPAGVYDILISSGKYNQLQISAFKIDRNQKIEETYTLFSDTTLKGKVILLNKPDFGVSNASISLQESGNTGYRTIRNTRTDNNGDFKFELTRAGKFQLYVAHKIYGETVIRVNIAEGEVKNIEVKLDPGTYLQGLVKNEKGEPVPNAKIYLTVHPVNQSLGYGGKNLDADNEGRFVIPTLKTGTHRLQVYSKQYYFNHQELVTIVEGENTVEVTMIKGVTVKIKLLSDNPIPEDLRVDLRRNLDKSPLPMLNVSEKYPYLWSKAEQQYSGMSKIVEGSKFADVVISGVHPGPYFITIRHEDLVEINEPIVIPENVKEVSKNLSISSGFAISGTVKNKKGQIVPDSIIRIISDGIYIKSVRLNADGKFFIQGLGNKTYNLIIEAINYKGIDKDITLTSSLIDQEFILDDGETLKGIVFDPDGKPVQNRVSIKLIAPPRGQYERHPMDHTDKDGRFEFHGLNKGKFKLEVLGTQYILVEDLEVNVPGDIQIHLSRGLRIYGVIKDSDNKPVNRASVLVLKNPKKSTKTDKNADPKTNDISIDTMDSSERVGSMPTNADGEYNIPGLKNGDYTIVVLHNNVPVNVKEVSLNSDFEHNVILDQTFMLNGNFKYTNGKIPSSFFISVVRKDNHILGSSANIDSKTGNFQVKGLTNGMYVLNLISLYSKATVYSQEVTVPQSKPLNIVIDEIKFFKLSAKILDEAGVPIKYPRIQTILVSQPDFYKFQRGKFDGSFEIKDMLPGTYKLVVFTKERKIINPSFEVKIIDKDIANLVLKAKNVVSGAYVKRVQPGSKAEVAGIKVGDIIKSYDGKTVTDPNILYRNSLKAIGTAGQVPIRIYRDGKEMTLMIEPGEMGIQFY